MLADNEREKLTGVALSLLENYGGPSSPKKQSSPIKHVTYSCRSNSQTIMTSPCHLTGKYGVKTHSGPELHVRSKIPTAIATD